MFGALSSVAGIGVGWEDYFGDFNLPYGMPVDHAEVWLGCDFHDVVYINHSGVDLNVGSGFDDLGLPIQAIMSGQVVYAGYNGDWGNLVVVENNGYQIWMAHLDEIWVTDGQIIASGDMIGALGNTGNSSGSHLHFGIKQKTADGQVWLDPKDYLDSASYWQQGCG
jgi:murein DD-endopeptidase MepM/ murein hydrolase activator NlpD